MAGADITENLKKEIMEKGRPMTFSELAEVLIREKRLRQSHGKVVEYLIRMREETSAELSFTNTHDRLYWSPESLCAILDTCERKGYRVNRNILDIEK